MILSHLKLKELQNMRTPCIFMSGEESHSDKVDTDDLTQK